MRIFRSRASVLATVALTWQIIALMIVPTAACCRSGAASQTDAGEMANCPMHHAVAESECPMHAQASADHDCHCPRLGCSQTDRGFLALFGPIGVLPANILIGPAEQPSQALAIISASTNSLAPVPAAPPPRS